MPVVTLPVERVPETLRQLYNGAHVEAVCQDEHGISLDGSLGEMWLADWKQWDAAYSQAKVYIETKNPKGWTADCGHSRIAFEAAFADVTRSRFLAETADERKAEADRAYMANRRKAAAERHAVSAEQTRIEEMRTKVDTSAITLWEHQERAIPRLFELVRQGKRRVLMVGPTGMGKMVLSAYLMAKSSAAGRHSLFLADIRELIGQCQEKLIAYGVNAGIIMAQSDDRNHDLAQVASKDTIWARAFRTEKMQPPKANALFVDEAHKSRAETWTKIIEHYKDSVVVGFTATPCRQDGKGLGALWDAMIIVATYEELRKAGVIVPSIVYAPNVPDLKGVPTSKGDYALPELRKRMDKVSLVGDIVKDWRKRADGRLTVAFATGVQHSLHIRNQFHRHGISCEHVDSINMSWTEREDILGRFHDGLITVVTNFGILTTGWDEPAVSCMINARPTRSLQLWRQMGGRVLRSYPGKENAIILDHAGCVFRHGYPDDDIDWELSQDSNVHEKVREKLRREAGEGKEPYACPKCSLAYRGPECPGCGYRPAPTERAVKMTAGELSEVEREKARERLCREHTIEQKQSSWDECLGWAIGTKRRTGAAARRYKELYGVFPNSQIKNLPKGKRQWNMDAREFYNEVVIGLPDHQE